MSAIALIFLITTFILIGFRYLFTYFSFFILVLGTTFFMNTFDIGFLSGLWLINLIMFAILFAIKIKNPDIRLF